jgi:DNA-binding transcriptional LysR family regulator
VADRSRSAAGTLRLSLCPALARRRMLEPTAAFLRARPELRVIVQLEDRLVDPIEEAIDVAVRVGPLGDSQLACQRLGSYGYVLVAAPAYLRAAPALAAPADLGAHAIIAARGARSFTRWGFTRAGTRTEVDVRPMVETNDAEVLRGLAVAGAGLTVLPDYLAEEDLESGRLVALLPGWQMARVPIHAVYASAAGLPRAARDWIAAMRVALSGRGGRRKAAAESRPAAAAVVVTERRRRRV